ncbi:RWD domain-containing protein 3 [Merluccius polli]|uniref:RWD domain-containing protein 3 n=1 Tax=Merluccius polli TaxID=89951 RepID=A0AA47NNU9_MERPO|nr:RWD domain-containing protein 3 [Merluccius polli]
MSEAALEEAAVLSSIYCGEGEYRLIQVSADDGVVVEIKTTVGRVGLSLVFCLPPRYPLCPPDISVSSPLLSRGQCQDIRRTLLGQAAALPQEPMVHQLVSWLQQSGEVTEEGEREACGAEDAGGEEWTSVLLLDHMRSRGRYVKLLERWTEQLHLTTTLLSGRRILVLLRGSRKDIKEFCHLLKTVKVDVDSSGKKCKERMMKVLCDRPFTLSSSKHGLASQGSKEYRSTLELTEAFQEADMAEMPYRWYVPCLGPGKRCASCRRLLRLSDPSWVRMPGSSSVSGLVSAWPVTAKVLAESEACTLGLLKWITMPSSLIMFT